MHPALPMRDADIIRRFSKLPSVHGILTCTLHKRRARYTSNGMSGAQLVDNCGLDGVSKAKREGA
eukprot:5367528-Pleurochrysis_carterae.AAC.2